MAYNVIINYSNRVGSTALIDSLKTLPDITVPIFEELDHWYLEREGLLQDTSSLNIGYAYESIIQSCKLQRGDKSRWTCIKWRIWGDLTHLIEVFKRTRVKVFNLVRGDGLEFISSLYLSNVIYGDNNAAQFLLKDAQSSDEKKSILMKYRETKIAIDIDDFSSFFRNRLDEEMERTKMLGKLQESGIDVKTIFYEDFAYQRIRFMNALLKEIGHDHLERYPEINLKKVSRPDPSSIFTNRSEIIQSNNIYNLINEWNSEIVNTCIPKMVI